MKRLKRIIRLLIWLLAGLALVYLFGPKPAKPVYAKTWPEVPAEAKALQAFIAQEEARHRLKPDNEARIIWASDSLKQPTEYALVYLHGFSASQEEGDPVHEYLAKTFGCNLYLSRLSQHGIDTSEQLLNLTADNYWETAKTALAIGEKLGRKVILIGTSTGGTQALQLAAAFPDKVHALILLSPNIAINDDLAWFANNPWGLQVGKLVKGGPYVVPADTRAVYKQYWNGPYRLEAVVQLQEMLETTMRPQTFASITQPLLLMHYYKDDEHQDKVVRVSAMLDMYEQLATPIVMKRKVPIPEAGDHVIGSYIKSGAVEQVKQNAKTFMEEVLQLKPVQNQ